MKVRNTFIIFTVSGFWHGANWTFIIWGTLNTVYFIPLLLTNNNRNNMETVAKGKIVSGIRELFLVLQTFSLTVFAWIFFRAASVSHAINYIMRIFSKSICSVPNVDLKPLLYVSVLILIEWI